MTARLDKKDGWLFKLGEDDSMEADPLYGHTCMRELVSTASALSPTSFLISR